MALAGISYHLKALSKAPNELIEACTSKQSIHNPADEPVTKKRRLDKTTTEACAEELFPIHLRSILWNVQFDLRKVDNNFNGCEDISIQEFSVQKDEQDSGALEFSFTARGHEIRFSTAVQEQSAEAPELFELLKEATSHVTPRADRPFQCNFEFRRRSAVGYIFRLDIRFKDSSLYEQIPKRGTYLHFFELVTPAPKKGSVSAWSPRDFYDSVFIPSKEDKTSQELKVPDMQSTLFAYQKRTVQWMLNQEGVDVHGHTLRTPVKAKRADGWVKSVTTDGKDVFVNQWLGLVSTNQNLIAGPYTNVSGGILAEEMGLGKTVEIIALITKHRRDVKRPEHHSPDPILTVTKSTLIIAPESIITQWSSEINLHAPALQTLIYPGIKTGGLQKAKELFESIPKFDIVLCSYSTLAQEVHFARDPPERNMRYKREGQHERLRSPLVQFHWWRCVLDECQMIESGVTNAAEVALQIPRFHAWAASGTPLRKDPGDIYGLYRFLQLCPYSWSQKTWARLLDHYQPIFRELIHSTVLRHTKHQVKDEIELPPQKRIVSTVTLTQVENKHYSDTFKRLCRDIGLSPAGAPLNGQWDPDDPLVVEQMRTALTQLRQLCLHPDIGGRNRRALGGRAHEVLRTVEEVLKVMTEQNEVALRTDERALFMAKLRKGQLLEGWRRTQEALQLWQEVLTQIQEAVKNARIAVDEAAVEIAVAAERPHTETTSQNARLGQLRTRLRSILELEHMAQFFLGNAYFQLKDSTDITEPGSQGFKRLEQLEIDRYDAAKVIRIEMLIEPREAAQKQIANIYNLHSVSREIRDALHQGLPRVVQRGGMESSAALDDLDLLTKEYNGLLEQTLKWRAELVLLLSQPLIDQDDKELEGDEYEISTKQQDEAYARMDIFRAVVSDLSEALTGQENNLIESEVNKWTKMAQENNGNAPGLMLTMLELRGNLKPSKNLRSVRGILAHLRSLEAQLQGVDGRRKLEADLIKTVSTKTRKAFVLHEKIVAQLSHDVSSFSNVNNARLEYYRQLQHISDLVAPFPKPENDAEAAKTARLSSAEQEIKHMQRLERAGNELDREETQLEDSIKKKTSQQRYLQHLKDAASLGSERKCIICQDDAYEIGILTPCGHLFCKECMKQWLKTSAKCPQCRMTIRSRQELYQITYKPQDLRMEMETTAESPESGSPRESSPKLTSIYSQISREQLNQIKSIDLAANFSTKIDFIARHIIWLRTADPGCKTVVFGQYKSFCPNQLAQAFDRLGIVYQTVAGKGIDRFKHDLTVECLLMHAGSQASGMNLVNASHVILCEPLVNTALELQAIARVHRIGQHRPTTIWMYLIEGTVEKQIYDLSVERRLEHIGNQKKMKQSRSTTPKLNGDEDIQAADAEDMIDNPLTTLLTKEGGGGEIVGKEDLWKCLFGSTQRDLADLEIDDELPIIGEPGVDDDAAPRDLTLP